MATDGKSTEPLAGVPRVRVLDKSGREYMRGYYVFHMSRQPAAFDDELRPQDCHHLVAVTMGADWNMPRE